MDKNTIWAIVLSTVVIIGAYLLMPLFMNKNQVVQNANAETVEVENLADESSSEQGTNANLASDSFFTEQELAAMEAADSETQPALTEEKITINTGCAEVVFTTRGGDILSYKLPNHIDLDTEEGVQLSDNVSEINRTCALALGTADAKMIDDIFTYERIDDYTLLFKKNFKVRDSSGNIRNFTLGKKYTFKPEEYMFKLDILIHSQDNSGLDINGASYTLRTSPQIGPRYNPKLNKYENRQFIAYNGKKAKRQMLGSGQFKAYDKELLWGGIAGKYFIELFVPTDPSIWNKAYYSSKVETDNYANAQGFFERRAFSSSDIQDSYYVYFGPRNEKDLKIYNISENNAWKFSGHKLTESLQTSGWLSWMEAILKVGLELLHKLIHNWGICIIIITIILKIILFPLSIKQSKGTIKMQALQPKLQEIQKKYAGDQQKMQIETQKIYKEAGYNPASGCLPLVFQFIVLIAMYNLFNNYFEFRGAMFIPGWIPDLSSGDSVFSWEKNIPLISSFTGNHLRLLPIIYVATQILSTKITQLGGATMGGNQNTMNMKLLTYGMPIMFFFLFYSAPAGLLLYWLTSNIWQVGQQLVINKMMSKEAPAEKTPARVQKTIPPKGKRK
ncbi:MAG: membrane protein insertase YidC [Treponema sp.]|nr:membrane protein insertase YidC [Treponema sp.]